jgi:hypothetical protein
MGDMEKLQHDAVAHWPDDAGPTSAQGDDLTVYEFREGFFVYAAPSDKDMRADILQKAKRRGYSAAFIQLLTIAQENDCKFVALDRDGPTYKELPTFNW